MRIKKNISSHIATFVLCSVLLFLFMYDSESSSAQLFRGLELCARSLIPALFPYMVISEILVRSGAAEFISPLTDGFFRKLFGISGAGGAAMLLGILCGFPVGAKIAAELYGKGAISKNEAERLIGICSLPSPPFIIFAVGEKLFGSRALGVFLYLNLLAVTLILGFLTRKRDLPACEAYVEACKPQPIFSVFTESVASASGAVIKVCAFVAFFSALTGGLSPFLASAEPTVKAGIISFSELASGMAACSAIANRGAGIIIASAAAGWSGISVFCQICSVSRTARGSIPMRSYLAAKAMTAAICSAVSAISTKIFPGLIGSSSAAGEAVSAVLSYPEPFISAVNIIFIISLCIYLIKKLDRRRIIWYNIF